MDSNDPKEFDDPLVSPDPKGISIGIMDKETIEKLVLHNIVRLFASGDAKCLKESNGAFTFHHFQLIQIESVSYTHLTLPTTPYV